MSNKELWTRTKRGYQLFEVLSAMQKAIRRGDARMAAYWAAEAYTESNKAARSRVWNRLMVISVEDCAGTTTQHVVSLRRQEVNAVLQKELEALRQADETVNKNKSEGEENPPCVIFVMKAARMLAMAPKCRDDDNFYCLVYLPGAIPEKELEADLKAANSSKTEPIPPEAYDKHTRRGQKIIREKGWTKKQVLEDFILRETKALKPRAKGEFDNLIDGLEELPWPEHSASNQSTSCSHGPGEQSSGPVSEISTAEPQSSPGSACPEGEGGVERATLIGHELGTGKNGSNEPINNVVRGARL
jgi:hypothetical protein